MDEIVKLIELAASWQTLLGAVLLFSLVPGVALHLGVLLYPKGHPRRAELIAELKVVPRRERPFWVTETLVGVVFEATPLRIKAIRAGNWWTFERVRRLALILLPAVVWTVLALNFAALVGSGPGLITLLAVVALLAVLLFFAGLIVALLTAVRDVRDRLVPRHGMAAEPVRRAPRTTRR